MKNSILFIFLLISAAGTFAQSVTTRAGEYDAGGVTEYAQYLYIGAGAHVTIPSGQQWVIASQYIFIAPTAVIDGGGQMIIDDPGNFGTLAESRPWAGQPTTIDGGGSRLVAPVVNRNPNNIILGAVDITPSSGDITTANTDHTLYISTAFTWATTHGNGSALSGNDVLLGSNDFKFATAATQTGYTPGAFAVTNGSGHVVKESYSGSWTFPVGIAEGDYTPASVSNSSANGVHVLVQNYATSASSEGGYTKGMDRTWNIYGDGAASAAITLVHNSVTNAAGPGTDGSAFNNAAAFVTRQTALGLWSVGTTSNGGTPVSSHTATLTIPATATDVTAYFSKSSDVVNSISDIIAVSPVVLLQGAMSGTAMTTTLNTLGVMPKSQPYNYAPYNYAGAEKTDTIPAAVTDWVLIELRDAANPATVVARRAAFVKKDGHVVDLDGVSAIGFSGVAAGNYFVAVRHRNHLGIRTPSSLNLTLNGAPVAYDFTTAQAKAYQNGTITTNPAMKDLGNGLFAMWGGDANSNSKVSYQGLNNDYNYLANIVLGGNLSTTLNNVYNNADMNMNGKVSAQGLNNDYNFLTGTVLNNALTIIFSAHL
ncbi:hypothetical protein ACTHGU_02130 [Chitinophagaceae bacterium MMS25-I14]